MLQVYTPRTVGEIFAARTDVSSTLRMVSSVCDLIHVARCPCCVFAHVQALDTLDYSKDFEKLLLKSEREVSALDAHQYFYSPALGPDRMQ